MLLTVHIKYSLDESFNGWIYLEHTPIGYCFIFSILFLKVNPILPQCWCDSVIRISKIKVVMKSPFIRLTCLPYQGEQGRILDDGRIGGIKPEAGQFRHLWGISGQRACSKTLWYDGVIWNSGAKKIS